GGAWRDFRHWEYLIEREEERDVRESSGVTQSYEPQLTTIVRALRILAAGRIAAPRMYVRAAEPGSISPLEFNRGMLSPVPVYSAEYLFLAKDAGVLQQIIMQINAARFSKSVEIAIGRVNNSGERMLIEDQFIDYVVALEALFGDNTDGLPGGITY